MLCPIYISLFYISLTPMPPTSPTQFHQHGNTNVVRKQSPAPAKSLEGVERQGANGGLRLATPPSVPVPVHSVGNMCVSQHTAH